MPHRRLDAQQSRDLRRIRHLRGDIVEPPSLGLSRTLEAQQVTADSTCDTAHHASFCSPLLLHLKEQNPLVRPESRRPLPRARSDRIMQRGAESSKTCRCRITGQLTLQPVHKTGGLPDSVDTWLTVNRGRVSLLIRPTGSRPSSGSRKSGAGSGRRKPVTTSRRVRRTPSGNSRISSAHGFGHEIRKPSELKSPSAATSSIGCAQWPSLIPTPLLPESVQFQGIRMPPSEPCTNAMIPRPGEGGAAGGGSINGAHQKGNLP